MCNYNYIRSANPKMTPSEILAECFKSGKSNDVFAKVLKQMKTLALPALVLCFVFAGGALLLVPLALVAGAFGLIKFIAD